MLCAYYNILDPNIDNINAQPLALMNQVKARLKDNWEYIGYELSYNEFKAHVNVFTTIIHGFFIRFLILKIPKMTGIKKTTLLIWTSCFAHV
jgi:hypothetical protein